MKLLSTLLLVLALSLLQTPLLADEARQITWDDLVPEPDPANDPMADLTEEERDLVGYVMYALETLPPRTPETERFYKGLDGELKQLEELNVDLGEIEEYFNTLQSDVAEELDGQLVRLPGYVLPLEYDEGKVTEFFLVPYPGACIHVPPPPANQIIHVKVGPSKEMKAQGQFYPVWLTGKITAQSMTEELFLVDGTGTVNSGYSMEAELIEPYE